MKHLLTTFFAICFSFTAAIAQEKTESTTKTPEKAISKEEKAAEKVKKETEKANKEAKKEADFQEAIKTAGFSAREEEKVRAILQEVAVYKKSLKEDGSLTEDEAKAKSKEFSKDSDAKIKTAVGEIKYKIFKEVQKQQKEAASNNN